MISDETIQSLLHELNPCFLCRLRFGKHGCRNVKSCYRVATQKELFERIRILERDLRTKEESLVIAHDVIINLDNQITEMKKKEERCLEHEDKELV